MRNEVIQDVMNMLQSGAQPFQNENLAPPGMQAPLETPAGSLNGMRVEEEKKQDQQPMTHIASIREPDSAAPNEQQQISDSDEGSLTSQNNEQ